MNSTSNNRPKTQASSAYIKADSPLTRWMTKPEKGKRAGRPQDTQIESTGFKIPFVCSALPLTQRKSDDLKISNNICFLNNTLMPTKFITPTFETIQETAQPANPKTLKES